MNNYTKETEEFVKKYTPKEGDEIILWQGNDNIGFTILKNYPTNISFKPVQTKSGKIDSVCMVKIGSPLRRVASESEDLKLFVSVSKASKYLLNNNFDYNFNDSESPTRDSIEESKRSKQPIDLEDFSGHVYDKKNNKIFNIEKGRKEVSINDIVQYIYELHLKTIKLSGAWFRLKLFVKNIITNPVEPINKFLLWFLNFFFGKTIQNEKDDSGRGLFKTYEHSSLYTLSDELIDFFNTGLKIPQKSVLLTAFSIAIITISLTYLTSYPKWWVEVKEQSQIIQTSFLLILLWIIDYIIPHIILIMVNMLIRFRKMIWEWKIKIK